MLHKHLNHFNIYSARLHCTISQLNSKNLLIFVFKIKEFVSRKLLILFTKDFVYFIFALIITMFNIIYHINNSFIIDKIKFLQTKVYATKFKKELKIYVDLKNSKKLKYTLAIFERIMIKLSELKIIFSK